MSNARLVARDACADFFAAAGACLVGEFRIADVGAYHAAEIGITARQNLLGYLWLVNAPGDKYGEPDFLFDRTQCSLFIDCFSGKKVWKTLRCMVK